MIASNHNEVEQEREELAVFDEFAEFVGMKVRSRMKCDQPAPDVPSEPDVLATFTDGSTVSFELLELCDETLKWKHGAHDCNRTLLQTAVDDRGAGHLHGKYIYIHISEYAKKEDVMSATSSIIAALNSLPAGFEGDVPKARLTSARRTVLGIYVKEMDLNGPLVTLGPVTSWTDSETASRNPAPKGWADLSIRYQEEIERKISKQYVSTAPIELLAWCGVWGLADASICWLPQLEASLMNRSDISPFRRIWIVNLIPHKQVLATISASEV